MTEAQVLAEINKVASSLAKRFAGRFPDMTHEDVEQEARLHCWECIQRGVYDGKRPLGALLFVHGKNRLENRSRDLLRRNDPPCEKCAAGNCCGPFGEPCESFAAWDRIQRTKTALMKPVPVEHTGEAERSLIVPDRLEEMEMREVHDLIDQELPVELRADYLRMQSGVTVERLRRRRVEAAILEIFQGAGVAGDLCLSEEEAPGQVIVRDVPSVAELVATATA